MLLPWLWQSCYFIIAALMLGIAMMVASMLLPWFWHWCYWQYGGMNDWQDCFINAIAMIVMLMLVVRLWHYSFAVMVSLMSLPWWWPKWLASEECTSYCFIFDRLNDQKLKQSFLKNGPMWPHGLWPRSVKYLSLWKLWFFH